MFCWPQQNISTKLHTLESITNVTIALQWSLLKAIVRTRIRMAATCHPCPKPAHTHCTASLQYSRVATVMVSSVTAVYGKVLKWHWWKCSGMSFKTEAGTRLAGTVVSMQCWATPLQPPFLNFSASTHSRCVLETLYNPYIPAVSGNLYYPLWQTTHAILCGCVTLVIRRMMSHGLTVWHRNG